MKTRTLILTTAVLAITGCVETGTGNDPGGTKPPIESASCAEYSSIASWQIVSADPISVVGHGAMLDSQGREVGATLVFIADSQKYYLKILYLQANESQRAEFAKKQQRLCATKTIPTEEKMVVNAALISWLINEVNSEDSAKLASKNAALIGGVEISPAMRERLKAEGLEL